MNNDNSILIGLLLIAIGFIIMTISMIFTSNKLEDFQKKAIKYNYATYDENNEFQWIIPEELKETNE